MNEDTNGWVALEGTAPRYRCPGNENDGRPVGTMRNTLYGGSVFGVDADMVWDPKDQYATCPPDQLPVDDSGRYYADGVRCGGSTHVWVIDTRIPLAARVFMATGYAPVLSYREWSKKAVAEAYPKGEDDE